MRFLLLVLLLLSTQKSFSEEYVTFHCEFPYFSNAEKAKQTQDTPFTSTFLVSAGEDGSPPKGTLVGSLGSVDVMVIGNGSGLFNFVEVTDASVINVTTLQLVEKGGKIKAVHSRHASAPAYNYWGPTQFYGECEIR